MAGWRVELRSGTSKKSVFELLDSAGPINDWRCTTAGAFDPREGSFTNQGSDVVPTAQPSWILHQFDVDKVAVGDTGPAEVFDSGGEFPSGSVTWSALEEM